VRFNPRTISMLLASCLLITAAFLTFHVDRPASTPDEWNISVTIGLLNTVLFALALVLFRAGARLGKHRNGASAREP